MKNIFKISLFTILVLFCVFGIAAVVLNTSIPIKVTVPVGNEYFLAWDTGLNKKQTYNSCASYAAMAYLYSVTKHMHDPEGITRNIKYKMKNSMTYPWGVTDFLNRHGISAKIFWLGLQSNEKKLDWIKQRISYGHPVILIISHENILHYITVVGYKGKVFEVYDSLSSSDKNGELPGNREIDNEELLKMWMKAKYKRIRIDMGIS